MTGPRNIVCVSDLHCGCRVGLHPDEELQLHEMVSRQSDNQKKMWSHWRYFWDVFVPQVTKGESYLVVVNGDALEGQPHGSKTPISLNTDDQLVIAEACLRPVLGGKCVGYRHIVGTESHVGKSGENERTLARHLGATPDESGAHARDFWWADLCGHLVHFAHHVGTTGARAYEMTAPHKEYVEFLSSAAQWGRKPPQLIVRSHRHRYAKPTSSSVMGECGAVVTPAWQMKTPFVSRLMMGRSSEPQIGGVVLRVGSRMGLYSAAYVYELERPSPEVIGHA